MKVSEHMNTWLSFKRPILQRSTYEAYTIYITRHINPYFDNLGKDLEELRAVDVQGYTTYKLTGGRCDRKKGGLSARSVRMHLNIIKEAFDSAVIWGIIRANPAAPIRVPRAKVKPEKVKFIDVEQAKDILAAFEGHYLYDLVCVTLYYGLRRSEALGLKWSAVDFVHDSLTIRHTIVKALTVEAKDSTKTESSYRVYPLLPELKELLQKRKAVQAVESPYIFTDAAGKLFLPDTVTRGFQRGLRRAGLEIIRFHDLRHATASILFDRGVSVADVQHWLGHSDFDTTMRIYVSYKKGRKLELGKNISGLFLPSTETPKTPIE